MPDEITPPPRPVVQATGSLLDTSTYEAINFSQAYDQLKSALEYVNDTRKDFEIEGPQPWVAAVADQLNLSMKKIRELEIKNAENMVERRDEAGGVTEVLVREADERGFDDLMTDYKRANDLFTDYIEKHVATLNKS